MGVAELLSKYTWFAIVCQALFADLRGFSGKGTIGGAMEGNTPFSAFPWEKPGKAQEKQKKHLDIFPVLC